jgi:NAD(P)H-dependent flavin oxidoreductase YrpB (nitropropane dioxygenase family)
MPGVSTPGLVAAVIEAGGVGMFPATLLTPADLRKSLDQIAELASGPVGVNFLMPFLDPEGVAVAASQSKLVEFFYGEPRADLVDQVHAGGALVSWQVGSAEEGVAAEAAGCDLVVAQGTEAGGHVRGTSTLERLLPEITAAVEVPVLAAGGISTAQDVVAAMSLGASGVRVGTRFVAAVESDAHPSYVDALIDASAEDTCLTEAYSVMWPDAPHRVLRSAIAAAEALSEGIVGETNVGGQRVPIPRFAVMVPSKQTTGHVEAMALYAGTSVTDVLRVQPAAEIVSELFPGGD